MFRRYPVPTAVVLGLAWLPLTIALRELFELLLPASEHEDRLVHGLQQFVVGAVLLAVLLRLGWGRRAWLTTRPGLSGGVFGLGSLAVVGAVVVLLAGLVDVDWAEGTKIAVSVFNYTMVGFTEELWFRGLIMGGLMLAWSDHRWGPLFAQVSVRLCSD